MKHFIKNNFSTKLEAGKIKQNGYVTLLVMLIVATVSFAIVLSALRSSVSSSQDSLAVLEGARARSYANGCVEDALYKIYDNPDTAVGDFAGVNCTYNTLATGAKSWQILAIGSVADITQTIKVTAQLHDSSAIIIDIGNWQENENSNLPE